MIFRGTISHDTPKYQRGQRDTVIGKEQIKEFNTYNYFGIFKTWNDVHSPKWNPDTKEDVPGTKGTPGVRSLFNMHSSVLTGAGRTHNLAGKTNQVSAIKALVHKASEFRLNNNTPLMDTPQNRKALREMSGCSVGELVKASKNGQFGKNVYNYADFMYCKHLGLVPNNYLITLRRFPVPVLDSMNPYGNKKSRRKAKHNETVGPIGTMVTWLGVSGNEMKSILTHSYKMAFEEKQAGWEQVEKIGGGDNGIFNTMEAMMNPATRNAWTGGTSNPNLDRFFGGFFKGAEGSYEYTGDKIDGNKVYGPIDRVKKNYRRSEAGLDWDMKFTIVFEYELKAYNGVNPRQAMLDLIAQILAVTYTTGGFWGGGYRGGGQRQSSTFSNLAIFKARGNFTNFVDAFSKDVQTLSNKATSWISEQGGIMGAIKSVMNMIGGMLVGGLLNKLGRPARYHANSLLSEAPVGLWHITIGNPWHPIVSMGNMILLNTKIEHSGPLGLDDFPTTLTVTCEFDRGKPRDQVGVEQMYMSGNDRIFHSMSQKVFDMYKASYQYKSGNDDSSVDQFQASADTEVEENAKYNKSVDANAANRAQGLADNTPPPSTPQPIAITPETAKGAMEYMMRCFGQFDDKAILWASREQAEGAFTKSKFEMTDEQKKKMQEERNKKK